MQGCGVTKKHRFLPQQRFEPYSLARASLYFVRETEIHKPPFNLDDFWYNRNIWKLKIFKKNVLIS